MKTNSLKKKIAEFKNNSKEPQLFKKEKYYEEINLRSFNRSFDVLIHHYKKTEASQPPPQKHTN